MASEDHETLVLLERVFLRLGSTETDKELEQILNKFLIPVILKLAEPSKVVQQKVIELLTHVNKRIKSSPVIQLPISDLLKQLSNSNVSPFVLNFMVIYLKMGYGRLTEETQVETLPELIHCITGKSQNQQNTLLQLFMKSLLHFKPPSNDWDLSNCFLFNLPSNLYELTLNSMINFLFLPYNLSQEVGEMQPNDPLPTTPPGMSGSSLRSLIGDVPLNCDEVEKIKVIIVQILGSFKSKPDEVGCPLLIASADNHHLVSNSAKVKLKQIMGHDEWNQTKVLKKLFEIFLGTTAAERNVKPTDKRMPCGVQLRIEIMNIFVKCGEVCELFPAPIQVVYESLFSANTTPKLKLAALQFVHQLCSLSSKQHFDLMSSMLYSAMVKVIQKDNEDHKVKEQAYPAIGKIGKRNPDLLTKNFSFVQQLFEKLSEVNEGMTQSVQECLMILAPTFRDLDFDKHLQLEAILMQNIEETSLACRQTSVRFASLVFPSKHLISRYVLLLACSDVKEEIVNEALKSLNDESLETPPFVDFVHFIDSKTSLKSYPEGSKSLPFKKMTYLQILKYAQRCLRKDVVVFNSLSHHDQLRSPHVGLFFKSFSSPSNVVQLFVNLATKFLEVYLDVSVLRSLLEIVAVTSKINEYEYLTQEAWLKEAIYGSSDEASKIASELYAIIVTKNKSEVEEVKSIVDTLLVNFTNQDVERQRGSLLCFGFIVAMTIHVGSLTSLEFKESFKKAIRIIAGKLEDTKQLSVSLAAYCCFNELARHACHVEILGDGDDDDDDGGVKGVTEKSIIQSLIDKVQSSKENQKIRENAAVCLSMMCVGHEGLKHKQLIIDGFLKTAEVKQHELHCVIGDALVVVGQGTLSSAGQNKWTSMEEDKQPTSDKSCIDMSSILDAILNKCLKSANPIVRQAGCVWLLALVQKVGDWQLVQDQIFKVQAAFISLLGESDELTQDVVSRGLAVVYEKGNEKVKNELVSSLIDSLMGNKRRKVEIIDSATNVFDEGSLGKTPEGQNISTYKELCSIANDLNQPDLIYKFMNLANHNASWNLKKGAARGFSTIASQASEQLAPYMEKILPKLYRFQFDPNHRVRGAMGEIWGALVDDQEKMLSKHLREILEDLEKNMTNPQWRVRESSCLALSDLLKGRQLIGSEEIIPSLWKTAFRVRDDIKESVRKAAEISLQSLSKITIKMCDATLGLKSSAQKTTSLLIPVLLDFGLASNVEEVRSTSLKTLIELSKSAGNLLKPHVTTLVAALLDSMTTLEPQVLNYLSLHAASNQSTLDMIDKARMSSYKSSPMMEVINKCIQMADATNVSSLVPKLCESIKNSVGLGTKICTTTVIISLVQKCPQDVAPFAGKVLAVLFSGLTDKNASLRKSYSLAIGHVVKVAKDSSVENLINRCQQWYFEKDDEMIREVCGSMIHSINAVCPDVVKRHSTLILPFVFFGMHELKASDSSTEMTGNSNCEEVWQEGTPCTEVGLKLYAAELMGLMQKSLLSPSWVLRSQCARMMLTFVEKLSSELSHAQSQALLSALSSALPGRIWEGKENLLKVLSLLCTNCKKTKFFEETDMKVDDLLIAIFKECRKDNLKYKIEAINCAALYTETYKAAHFKELWELLTPLIRKKEKDGDDDDDDFVVDKKTQEEALKVSFNALAKCWPSELEVQKLYQEDMCAMFLANIGFKSWQTELSLIRSLQQFFKRWFVLSDGIHLEENQALISSCVTSLMVVLCRFLGNSKNSTLRAETISTLELLIDKLTGCQKLNMVKDASFRDELVKMLREVAENDTLDDLRIRAKNLQKTIS